MTELNPCPFCGGKAEIHRSVYSERYRGRCKQCGAQTMPRGTKENAIEDWNRRTKVHTEEEMTRVLRMEAALGEEKKHAE